MNKPIVSLIIQMRNNSSRLPYKVTKKIMDKYTMEYLLERVKKTKLVDNIIVATTTSEKDDVICSVCRNLQIKFYRGSEQNVLDRYFQAALISNSDIVVRVTGDCILIDPLIIDKMIEVFKNNNCDFLDPIYSGIGKGGGAGFPDGFNPEIFSFKALEKAYENANTPDELEHVTGYIINNLNCMKYNIILKEVYHNIPFERLQLSLDTKRDLDIITCILTNLYPDNPNFTIDDVLSFLNQGDTYSNLTQNA